MCARARTCMKLGAPKCIHVPTCCMWAEVEAQGCVWRGCPHVDTAVHAHASCACITTQKDEMRGLGSHFDRLQSAHELFSSQSMLYVAGAIAGILRCVWSCFWEMRMLCKAVDCQGKNALMMLGDLMVAHSWLSEKRFFDVSDMCCRCGLTFAVVVA